MHTRVVAIALVAWALGGCSSEDTATTGSSLESIYVVPDGLDQLDGETWLDHPWPSDVRLEGGSPRFAGFHNPRNIGLVAEYVDFADGLLDGFSPVAAGYLRFAGALDPATLPQSPGDTLSPESSVQLIDVDPSSPEFQNRRLIELSFRSPAGHYVLPDTLRWFPALGSPLRPNTRYALVVSDAVSGLDGGQVAPSAELRQVLGLDAPSGPRVAVHDAVAGDLATLSELGLPAESIVHLGIFTTADPTAETVAVTDHLRAEFAAPDFAPETEWTVHAASGYVEYRGAYGPSPNYQRGTLPFKASGDGGDFNFVDGVPEVVDSFDLRTSISIPDSPSCPMPAAGYPIVLYAHGTGGSWRSYTSYGATMAEQCIAVMGVDQIFHGTRPGAPASSTEVELLFFNFQNVEAGRTNNRQSAIDEVQRARLFSETQASIPASLSHTGAEIRFDPDRIMFMGHSQGGLNGPLYLAIDDSARGGVLSGSGSVIMITLLEKTEPQPSIANLVATIFLALLTEEREELDLFHPALMVAQSLVDVIDPINYARLTVNEPRAGFAPKSVLMTEGIAPDGTGDNFTPPRGTEAQAIAMGLPLMLPGQLPYPQLDYGAESVTIPSGGLSGNLADGAASGVLSQWPPAPGEDGHFVVFDVPEARAQVAGFLRNLADDPQGNVPAP